MSIRTWGGAFALLTVFALTSCSKSTTPAPGAGGSLDQTLTASVVTSDPNFTSDDLMAAAGQTPASGATPSGALAAIQPRFFWRTYSSMTRTFTWAFADSDSTGRPRTADVTVTRHLLGTFHLLKALASDSTRIDTANIVLKPIDETWTRRLHLRRVRLADSTHTEWRVVAVSGVQVLSNGATTRIQSLRIQSTGVDTTVTDPLAFWSMARSLHFAGGDSVMVTATTGNTDDVVLAYWHDHRERFHGNGDGTYTFKLRIGGLDNGFRWSAVNALSHGTFFDDVAPYDSNTWILHCFVGGLPGRDYF